MRCQCGGIGGSKDCVQYGEEAGKCVCQEGYAGPNCDECASGFRGFPNCERCPCDLKGVVNVEDCEGSCVCKVRIKFQRSLCFLNHYMIIGVFLIGNKLKNIFLNM